MATKAVVSRYPSPNHDARPVGTPIDMLVLHYTGVESVVAAFWRLTNPAAKVSAHYLVDEEGNVEALVSEGRRAWHAKAAQEAVPAGPACRHQEQADQAGRQKQYAFIHSY